MSGAIIRGSNSSVVTVPAPLTGSTVRDILQVQRGPAAVNVSAVPVTSLAQNINKVSMSKTAIHLPGGNQVLIDLTKEDEKKNKLKNIMQGVMVPTTGAITLQGAPVVTSQPQNFTIRPGVTPQNFTIRPGAQFVLGPGNVPMLLHTLQSGSTNSSVAGMPLQNQTIILNQTPGGQTLNQNQMVTLVQDSAALQKALANGAQIVQAAPPATAGQIQTVQQTQVRQFFSRSCVRLFRIILPPLIRQNLDSTIRSGRLFYSVNRGFTKAYFI